MSVNQLEISLIHLGIYLNDLDIILIIIIIIYQII